MTTPQLDLLPAIAEAAASVGAPALLVGAGIICFNVGWRFAKRFVGAGPSEIYERRPMEEAREHQEARIQRRQERESRQREHERLAAAMRQASVPDLPQPTMPRIDVPTMPGAIPYGPGVSDGPQEAQNSPQEARTAPAGVDVPGVMQSVTSDLMTPAPILPMAALLAGAAVAAVGAIKWAVR